MSSGHQRLKISDPQRRPRKYAVGDVINLVMDVGHRMKLTGARAVFAHAEVDSAEIVLEGELEMYMKSGPFEDGILERGSFVVMSEEVTVEHIPGVYRFSYVEFETASLRTIRPRESDIHIEEEPKELEIVADSDELDVSVTLEEEQIRTLYHEDIRDRFEEPVDTGADEE